MPCNARFEAGICELAERNPVHHNKRRFNYHEYVPPPDPEPSALDRLSEVLDNFSPRGNSTYEALRLIEEILKNQN